MFGLGKKKQKDQEAHSSDQDASSQDESTKKVTESAQGEDVNEVERIHTFERVGTHAQYYEKDGLRTEGDGQDHDGTYQKMTPKLFFSLVAMSFLWVGSQIPLYLFGGVLPDIYSDIGGYPIWIWFVIGYLIPNASLCPFVGALSDLFGRKYVGIMGQVALIVGPIITCTAPDMITAVGGQVISGAGAGLNELIALAATGELVPTSKRGAYVGGIVFTILPFAPSVLWAELIVKSAGWRYIGIFVAGWNFVGLLLVAFLYFPPPRPNSLGYTKMEILKRVDYIGGFLSIAGVLLFMLGMQWSVQQYKWTSVPVLVTVILGFCLVVVFFIYEINFAKHKMCPDRIFSKAFWDMTLILIITFLSGANFFVMLLFWPTEIYNVYGRDRIGIGIRSLPIGFGILSGAVISLVLIPITKGRIKAIMIFFTALMTAGTGAMSVATTDNINTMYGICFIASAGVGGVIIPCSIIAQILCPDDLIATVTAITLSIRYLGGAVGFTVYYNIFYKHAFANITKYVGTDAIVTQIGYIISFKKVKEIALAAGHAEFDKLFELCKEAAGAEFVKPAYKNKPADFCNVVITATQYAFAKAYVWPYYISIAFGGVCFILAWFLGDIKSFLDEHIAVVL